MDSKKRPSVPQRKQILAGGVFGSVKREPEMEVWKSARVVLCACVSIVAGFLCLMLCAILDLQLTYACTLQDDGFELPVADFPDADDGEAEAEPATEGADVKDEDEGGSEERSSGFAPAPAKEKSQLGVEKLHQVDDWRAMRDAAAAEAAEMEDEDGADAKTKIEDSAAVSSGGAVGLPLEEDGSLNMFWIDAYEDNSKAGRIYMFGKVRTGEGKGGAIFSSCCLQIDNVQRQVFILPREKILDKEVRRSACLYALLDSPLGVRSATDMRISKRPDDDGDSQGNDTDVEVSMMDHVFPEFSQIARQKGIKKHSCKVTRRAYMYNFQDAGIPKEAQYLKVLYPAEYPAFPADLAGRSFSRVLGTSQSCLELFLLKRDLMGPCWVNIKGAEAVSTQLSWCKHELRIDGPKNLKVVKVNAPDSPPLSIMSLHMQTVKNDREHSNEIVMLSALCHKSVNVDGPTDRPENAYKGFTAVRKLDGAAWPLDLQVKVEAHNKTHKDGPRSIHANERALLCWFLAKLQNEDPDVIVGHNWLGFDLDVLLHRMQRLKIPAWSKLGRLRRSVMPKLQSNAGGMGQTTWAEKSIMSGRLICDTYLAAKENLRETTYTLTELTRTQLQGKVRQEIDFQQVSQYFSKTNDLMLLMGHNEHDTYLAACLMFKMMVLPLTKQLTNLAGNLWNRSLLSARAERVEYLLLHEFHRLKYVLPEKAVFNSKKGGADKADDGADNADGDDEEGGQSKKWSKRKKAAYSGGLVLDPKRGLYDKHILLLDFNSLYPTIIQEYNICFTTVTAPPPAAEGEERPRYEMPDKDGKQGVLPKVIKTLVDRRRQVKELIKKENDNVRKQQLDIRQSALKIMANSMYGCLGFTYSRFYAKPLAEMVTSQGRELLQRTVDVTQNKLQLEVVYGDTDSIFVNSGCDNIQDANRVARETMKELNRMWKLLEVGLDGIYCPLLLLNKKKYAALEVTERDGVVTKLKVRKGLDIVRRDWCVLAKEVGDKILDFILSGEPVDEVVEKIHSFLRETADAIENSRMPLAKFIITKGLTKGPEEYSDAKSQPHVQVALKMKAQGKPMRAGDHVPYVICADPNVTSFAQRAQDPTTVEAATGSGKFVIDKKWYFESQIHPVVSRICASIQGTDSGQLAACLGLDSSKFHKADAGDSERKSAFAQQHEAADRFENVEKLQGMCSDGLCREFTGVYILDKMGVLRCGLNHVADSPGAVYSPSAMRLQLGQLFRKCLAKYHDGWLVCSDNACAHRTRNVLCDVYRDSEEASHGLKCPVQGCSSKMRVEYTSEQLYLQALYTKQLFDLRLAERKLAEENVSRAQRNLLPLRPPLLEDADKVMGLPAMPVLSLAWLDWQSNVRWPICIPSLHVLLDVSILPLRLRFRCCTRIARRSSSRAPTTTLVRYAVLLSQSELACIPCVRFGTAAT